MSLIAWSGILMSHLAIHPQSRCYMCRVWLGDTSPSHSRAMEPMKSSVATGGITGTFAKNVFAPCSPQLLERLCSESAHVTIRGSNTCRDSSELAPHWTCYPGSFLAPISPICLLFEMTRPRNCWALGYAANSPDTVLPNLSAGGSSHTVTCPH